MIKKIGRKSKAFIGAILILGASSVLSSATLTVVRQQLPGDDEVQTTIQEGYPQDIEGNPNILLGKTAVASNAERENPASNAIDNDETTRWATTEIHSPDTLRPNGSGVSTNNVTLEIDLGAPTKLSAFKIHFQVANVTDFAFQYQDNTSGDWKTAAKIINANGSFFYVNLPQAIMNVTKVRFIATKWGISSGRNYRNISVFNFAAYSEQLAAPVVDPNPNYLLARRVNTSSQNIMNQGPNAVDDDTINPNTFWQTADKLQSEGPHVYTIDLSPDGREISSFRLRFGNNNVRKFKIETSSAVLETNENQNNFVPSGANNTIQYENFLHLNSIIINSTTRSVRRLRLTIEEWEGNRVQLFNIQAHPNHLTPANSEEAASLLSAKRFSINTMTNTLDIGTSTPDFPVNFIGADFEQVINSDLSVNRPLTSKTISFDFEVTNRVNPSDKSSFFRQTISVPGLNTQENGKNTKPKTIPEISEWFSSVDANAQNANLTLNADLNVFVVATAAQRVSYEALFRNFSNQYQLLSKKSLRSPRFITPEERNTAVTTSGNIIFDISNNNIPGFDEETYGIIINDNNVTVRATAKQGAVYGFQTLLQMLKIQSTTFNTLKKGEIKDYPKFKTRSISLDVANKPTSLETLRNIVREMSWNKLNELQLNLADNNMFLEDFIDATKNINAAYNAYSGFRLESSITNDDNKITSSDFSYTKQQFKEFMQFAENFGVKVVPYFNFPAHALSITKVFKNLANPGFPTEGTNLNRPLVSNLNLTESSIATLQRILNEYFDGPNAIFPREAGITVNIGGGDVFGVDTLYLNFMKQMILFLKLKGVKVRINGDLKRLNLELNNPITTADINNVEVVVNNVTDKNAVEIYNKGYDIINSTQSPLLILPTSNTGDKTRTNGGSDLLETQNIYDSFDVENIGGTNYIPVGSAQLKGAILDLQNRFIDSRETGLTSFDIYNRLLDAIPVFAAKTWGKGENTFAQYNENLKNIGRAPGSTESNVQNLPSGRYEHFNFNFIGRNDASKLFDKRGENGFITGLNGASLGNETNGSVTNNFIKLNGDNSSAMLPTKVLGVNNNLKFRIKRLATTTPQDEEIIFSAASEIGDFSIKAKQKRTGKFGFSREGVDFSFDYELPLDTYVDIELRSTYSNSNLFGNLELWVNGTKMSDAVGKINRTSGVLTLANGTEVTVGQSNTGDKISNGKTFMFPLEKLGANKNSFRGMITNISSEPLTLSENKLIPTPKTPEVSRLENLNLAVVNRPTDSVRTITNNDILVTRNTDANVIQVQIKRIPRDNNNIIAQITLQSTRDQNAIFTRDYFIRITTRLINIMNLVREQESKFSDFSLYTPESVINYRNTLNSYKITLSATGVVNDVQSQSLITQLNNIPNILVTFSNDIKSQINALRSLNPGLYLTNSFTSFLTDLNEFSKTVDGIPNLSAQEHNELNMELKVIKEKLVSLKDVFVLEVRNRSTTGDPDLQTQKSIDAHRAAVNVVLQELIKDNNVDQVKINTYRNKLEQINQSDPLISYTELTKENLDAINEEIGDPQIYREAERITYLNLVKEINDTIEQGGVTKKQNDEIRVKLNIARDSLVKIVDDADTQITKLIYISGIMAGSIFLLLATIFLLIFRIKVYKRENKPHIKLGFKLNKKPKK